MPGQAIGTTFNIGYPGSVSKSPDTIIRNAAVLSTDTTGPSFGDPVVLNSDNTVSKASATTTAATFKGIAIREVKQTADYYTNAGAYLPGQACDFITRGEVCVTCQSGTPTAGSTVYLRTVAGTLATAVGGFEAASASDGGTTVALTNAVWTTGKIDSNLTAEITILSRQA